MGSTLEPALANTFEVFHEKGLLPSPNKPVVYFRNVDDTFYRFSSQTVADSFFTSFNNIIPVFTQDWEINFTFLDILVCRTTSCFINSIYHKPTFTSFYTYWDSFCPTKKINLIKAVTH